VWPCVWRRISEGYSEIKRTPIQTAGYGVIPLSAVADLEISEGPPMISSENAMLRGTVLFNVRGRDMGSVVSDAKKKIEEDFKNFPKVISSIGADSMKTKSVLKSV
jgi:Cu/Ag efflux pump CusA